MNKIFIIRRENKPEDLFRPEVETTYNWIGSSGHCLLYELAGYQSFQETVFIKMELSRGHFYKTIEEVETAMKQYSKKH